MAYGWKPAACFSGREKLTTAEYFVKYCTSILLTHVIVNILTNWTTLVTSIYNNIVYMSINSICLTMAYDNNQILSRS